MPSASAPLLMVIGGGGFLGTALRNHFTELGWRLCTVGRGPVAALLPDETYYSVKEYSFRNLEELFQGHPPDAVVDLAYTSVPNTSFDDPIRDFSDNLYNVIRHLEFAKAVGVGCYVYISSGGTVYGDLGLESATEDAPVFPLSPYGITKLACERYVNLYYRLHGVSSVILRPANVYGPGQIPFRGQGLIATALGLVWRGQPVRVFGNGSHTRDYLYVDDFCTAVAAVIARPQPGSIFNVGSGAGVSIHEIINHISTIVAPSGYTLRREQMASRPFDVRCNVLDVSRMGAAYGWKPQIALDEGLKESWKWVQKYLGRES